MHKIIELEPHVADLIAAGEVVEKPASVVKELLENSIDAGAKVITVEITAGGMTYIRITDNGCGIAPEDVTTAFQRHATSKLRNAEGLEAINTLGFRGEALAAIAAVSRIELLTREPGAVEGVSLSLTAGAVTDLSPAGCPEGTTIIVRDLFFNTPARKKFMKSDRAESSSVASAVLRTALSRPDVSIRFIRDGKTECHTPGDSRADSCIYSLLGREFSAGLVPAESSDEVISVTGFVSTPSAARGNRSYQFFFVNKRPIMSRTLQAALEQAYSNSLPLGRYPSCVLYITTNPGAVDVNVHPAKTEVKFISDKQVFDCVYYAALRSYTEYKMQNAELILPTGSAATPLPDGADRRGGGFQSMNADEFRKTREKHGDAEFGLRNRENDEFGTSKIRNSDSGIQNNENSRLSELHYDDENLEADDGTALSVRDGGGTDNYSEFLIPNSGLSNGSAFRVIGEAMKTYIIVEYRDSVWFIDKHAAHERIHFDALKSRAAGLMSQSLVTPVICRHDKEDTTMLLENADMLDELGFTVENFGDDAVAVRQIPSEIDISDAESVLTEICEQLKVGGTPELARRDEIYRSIACKAAIKAGKSSDIRELQALTARVLSGEVAQCPHGRPVAFEVTQATLDRGFRRA